MANYNPNTTGLVSFADMSPSERAAIQRKGMLASQEKARRQRTFAEMARAVLNMEITATPDVKLGALSAEQIKTIGMAILAVHATKAMEGDVASARLLMDAAEKGKENNTAAAGVQIIMAKGDEKL